jgi:serine/threonine-protein kinase
MRDATCSQRSLSYRDKNSSQTQAGVDHGEYFRRKIPGVVEELGRGGMGRVYKVIDTKLEEELALKLIHPEIAVDERIIKRFGNELKMARKISHKNVCRMYHLEEDEGIHYLTMEFIRGESLKDMIGMMGQLSPGQALSVVKQVCEGLAEAHKLAVVHRDLKPSNIMIDREGNARIMDFGIARSLKAKGITRTGTMIDIINGAWHHFPLLLCI